MVFSVSSILLAVFLGAALGNVVRGVPLDSTGYFFEPLWTNFRLGPQTGILDWYTIMAGGVALVTLTAHGSYYVAIKTDEDLGRRARGIALLCWPLQFFLTCISLVATYFVRPSVMDNYAKHKIGLLVPVLVFGSLAVMLWANPKGKEKLAFVASSLYITGMLVGAAFALYPVVLPARDPQYDLTIYNTAAGKSRPERGRGLVDSGSGPGDRVFRLHLPHVPGQGAVGRGTLLEQLSAVSHQSTRGAGDRLCIRRPSTSSWLSSSGTSRFSSLIG